MANDVWQVQVQGTIYEADSETLKQWATQGNLLPQDFVKKGNLNWTPAANVPMLRPIFGTGGLTSSATNPVHQSGASLPAYAPPPPAPVPGGFSNSSSGAPVYGTVPASTTAHLMVCRNHPQVTPDYVCRACAAPLCKNCVKLVANRVPVCSVCGELCQPYAEIAQQMARDAYQTSGFGVTDLFDGFRFPFTDVVALIIFCIVYAVMKVGAGFGGLFGWIILTVVSTGMLFATMSTVIRRVADGRVNEGYAPDFGSAYDDVIHPFFLSIGVILISFGPAIVAVLYAGIGIISAFFRGAGEDQAGMREAMAKAVVALVFAGVAAVWAVLYYPMALLVAGFSQSFTAVINPLVGLDTIRRMGATYGGVFLMYLVIGVANFTISYIVGALGGRIAGSLIAPVFEFYFSIVLSYVLGIALFKCSSRLGLE